MKKWILENIPRVNPKSDGEELVNGITHLLGALACIPGGIILIRQAVDTGNRWYLVSAVFYMISMFVLYASSTFYHFVKGDLIKRIGRILDHFSIYLLIAGTYTPVAFKIWEPWGVIILILIWGLAIVGFVLKLFFWRRFKAIHTAIYLAMGWTIVMFWPVFTKKVDAALIPWTIAGGLSYTLGVAFYAMKKIPFAHGIWHLFVLSGSVSFYFGILKYVIV